VLEQPHLVPNRIGQEAFMKSERNNGVVAAALAALVGLGLLAASACGASTNTEREREVTTTRRQPGGEYERVVWTQTTTDQEEDGRTQTTERDVDCEAEGNLSHLCGGQRSAQPR
jgi:hypothetical protein